MDNNRITERPKKHRKHGRKAGRFPCLPWDFRGSRDSNIVWLGFLCSLMLFLLVGCSSLMVIAGRDYCKDPSDDPAFQMTKEFCQMSEKEIQLVNDEGKSVHIQARIADEPAERAAGYQKIGPQIIARTFILFVFDQDMTGSFHMCNVVAPLDIAWIRSDGSILDVWLMEPGPVQPAVGCPKLYAPGNRGVYRYALETRKDFFKENKISPCHETDAARCKAHLTLYSSKKN